MTKIYLPELHLIDLGRQNSRRLIRQLQLPPQSPPLRPQRPTHPPPALTLSQQSTITTTAPTIKLPTNALSAFAKQVPVAMLIRDAKQAT